MGEYFMGQELMQRELPPNSPRPEATPPDGIIMTDVALDGSVKRFLYKSHMGERTEILISDGGESASPAGPAGLGGPTAFMNRAIPIRNAHTPPIGPMHRVALSGSVVPIMGQAQAPTPQPAPAPIRKCPGPVEMPDGKKIEPGDPITLNDLCELMPFLMEGYQAAAQGQKGQPQQRVQTQAPGPTPYAGPGSSGPIPTVQPGMGSPVGGAGFPSFGPGSGGFGGGGGGGGGAPPQGTLGPIQSVTPIGQGGTGPQGPSGPSSLPGFDFILKTDGDFTAGPGAFVPVPGTLISFNVAQGGNALFIFQTVPGTPGATGFSQSGQLGIRVDGVDIPITTRLLHTFVGGVGEFFLGQPSIYAMPLLAGAHTVEAVIRALLPAEYGGGIGIPFIVGATPSFPLSLIVIHG